MADISKIDDTKPYNWAWAVVQPDPMALRAVVSPAPYPPDDSNTTALAARLAARFLADNDDVFLGAEVITPDNDNDLVFVPNGIYVGGGGTVKVDMPEGSGVTFSGVPSGTTLDIRPTRIYASGTSATHILALR